MRRLVRLQVIIGLFLGSNLLGAQQVIATIPVGIAGPIAINQLTNKIYVSNETSNTVTVIDGASLSKVATIPVAVDPYALAVNPVTNKIYVSTCGSDNSCRTSGAVTVIDGATNQTTNVSVGVMPRYLAVNPVTNKIYVPNSGDNTVTVIDGVTNSTHTLTVGHYTYAAAIDTSINRIFVTHFCCYGDDPPGVVTAIDGNTNQFSGIAVRIPNSYLAVNSITDKIYVDTAPTVTVIDGRTLMTTQIDLGSLGGGQLVLDEVTNKIYSIGPHVISVIDGYTDNYIQLDGYNYPVAVGINSVTDNIFYTASNSSQTNLLEILDGDTNLTSTLTVGNQADSLAVDLVRNRVYVSNLQDSTVSVVAWTGTPGLQFVPMPPCRVVDTRPPHGSGPITGGTSQSFILPQLGGCGIPSYAAAYSLNTTVVPRGHLEYLTIWPTGQNQPYVSTLNAPDGRAKANATIVPAGYQGAVSVFVTDTTDVILDINGYFVPASPQTYQFYPLAPCRVIDTRGATGPLGGPHLHGGRNDGSHRDFPVRGSDCIPANANVAAYSLNFTVAPHVSGQRLGYLTVWPEGSDQPFVSTLNNPTATVVANAAIVPAGTDGGISVFAYDDTDMIADINGYFGPAGQGGYSFYPAAPCRAYDSRDNNGQPFQGTKAVNIAGSPCAPPATARGYVFNATVVPDHGHPMGYLTLWPDGEDMPLVSTLNAYDGLVTSNMAIVPNDNGSVDAYADGLTHLILDISGYFAP